MDIGSTAFWLALGQIVWINILLSGDNAVVIALAARSLPPKQQKQAIMIGSGAAIVMRIVLTLVAAQLLQLPWLKLIGAALLVYIGVTLVLPEDEEEGDGKEASGMVAAVRTILIADLVMSLDNVIAVAAAAKGDTLLLIVGLAMSIPLVIFGSTLLLKVIERFPIVVWLGAGLLGFIAGEIVVDDPAIKDSLIAAAGQAGLPAAKLGLVSGLMGVALVLLIGWVMSRRQKSGGHGATGH
ncbi:MAG: TerC family protein [Betaproteobacteria bacterium]|nr:TerC family protein [Betaproteobacteria bacterium]